MAEANNPASCANAIVEMRKKRRVTHAPGLSGAKMDSLFIALNRSNNPLVRCPHERNAAPVAAAFGSPDSITAPLS